jgi:quercetin dioxygenase-like cupin family protein
MQYVFPTTSLRRYRFPTHANDLVMDRAEAATSEVFIVEMAPGEAPPRHRHDDMEQIFYVLAGQGRLEIGEPVESFMIGRGDVVRIPVSTWHTAYCLGDQPLRYLAVDCFIAGRPAAEPTWDDHVRVVCQEQGWDYDTFRNGQ